MELNSFICEAIKNASTQTDPNFAGIMIVGFPRCPKQLDSWTTWPFQQELPLAGGVNVASKPDVVLSLRVTMANAKTRYVAWVRDKNDEAEKFERRFAEYDRETLPVEAEYRRRGVLIDVITRVLGERQWLISVA
jgi:adenylate kinase family enzyme